MGILLIKQWIAVYNHRHAFVVIVLFAFAKIIGICWGRIKVKFSEILEASPKAIESRKKRANCNEKGGWQKFLPFEGFSLKFEIRRVSKLKWRVNSFERIYNTQKELNANNDRWLYAMIRWTSNSGVKRTVEESNRIESSRTSIEW